MIKLNSLKVSELNTLLRANDLPTTGTKATKVSTLQEVLGMDEIDLTELEDGTTESTYELKTQINSLREAVASLTSAIGTMNRSPVQVPNNDGIQQTSINNNDPRPGSSVSAWESADNLQRSSRPRMSIQDMIGVMPEFEPLKGSTSSTQFINRIEQLQQCYGWQEELVLIAIQHKLKGMAKSWLDAQSVFESWSQFVHEFKVDFPSTQNAAETHKTLMKRKRKNGEDYLEYYYSMLTIGRQGKVDDVSIITHIISGLNDGALTKTLAAMNLATCSHLLVALKNLTTVSGISVTPTAPIQQIAKTETKINMKPTLIKCFNCNEYGHIAGKCPQPQRKPRCTVCSRIGHEAKNCSTKTSVAKIDDHSECEEAPPVMKIVELNGKQLEAFIDTGSVCSLIRASVAEGMQTQVANRCFTGFGGSEVQVNQQVNVVASVDNRPRKINLYIVADKLLPYDILLGRDVLQNNGYQMVIDNGVLHLEQAENENFIDKYDIQHVKVAVRTPRANGQAERVNKTILASLKCSTTNDRDWDEALPHLQLCLSSQSNATTRQSPNSLVFNYKLREVTVNRLIQAVQDDSEDEMIQHDDFRMELAAERINAERAKWKQRFDAKHQTPRQYNEGDLVVVDYVTPPTGTSHKLDPSYKGPYLVTKVLPNDRYVVEDLPDIPKRRKRYAGIFTNDNMKPWCANGLIDDNCEDENNIEETTEGIYDEKSLRGDDLSGKAELSNTAGNPTTQNTD